MLSRTFSPKSHVAAMLYCQVSKTESLNSICDVAHANEALWSSMGMTPPMRNILSDANARRPSGMAKDLYRRTFNYLTGISSKFGKGPHGGYCFRIKAVTHNPTPDLLRRFQFPHPHCPHGCRCRLRRTGSMAV